MANILLTGAAGYIASHTWCALVAAGHTVVGVDNFVNSSPKALERLGELLPTPPVFEEVDVCDKPALAGVFKRHAIDAVIHFAALKAVGESTQQPLSYYRNNIGGLLTVCEVMAEVKVHNLVFSSSATVYGQPERLPITESSALSATNPYGQTKLFGEQILRDLEASTPGWCVAYLRYFNPVGAHPSGRIGEDPRGVPNNLMPYVAQVAVGKREFLQVFGRDYDTHDGTGVRDYIHVMDLAEGHVAAVDHLLRQRRSLTVNLGTGQGYSVLDVIKAYEKASGQPVAHRFADRRPGDVAACYADPTLAHSLLGWTARRDLDTMCEDSWRWQHLNPNGFA